MAQLKCSNCGGYKITTPAGDVYQHPDLVAMYFLVGGVVTLGGLIALSLGELLWGVFILVVGVFMLVMANVTHKDQVNYSRTHHECLICGKKWETPD